MKKYLMTGVAALAMCAAFTSCSHDEVTQLSQQEIDKMNYDKAFLTYVGGKIANDQDWGFSTTRTAFTNDNQWFDPAYRNYERPADITSGEIEVVTKWFAEHGKQDGTTLDLNNYFVQQVSYGGINHVADTRFFEKYEQQDGVYREVWRNGTETITANSHMDLLWANMDNKDDKYDHINNFNTSTGSMMCMENSETKYGFGYHESYGTAKNDVYQNYLLAHVTGTASDGTVVDGYYVGFDYQCYKQETYQYTDENGQTVSGTYYSVQLDPDGVYNDRIVKIVPARKKPIVCDIRIIAEDLSATDASDFDFNDIVLDVKYGNPAILVLQAAGGTLPLRIAYNDEWETHKLFGVWNGDINSKQPMVNTGAGPTKDPVVFNYTGAIWSAYDAKSITLEVYKNGAWQPLTAERGEPAAKLCVDTTYEWLGERVSIKGKYSKFIEWVELGSGGFTSKWWQ